MQTQLFTQGTKFSLIISLIICRSVTYADKAHILSLSCQQRRRLEEGRMILHCIQAPHQTNEFLLFGNAPLAAYVYPRPRIRSKIIRVDAVGHDLYFPPGETTGKGITPASMGIRDDKVGKPR